MEDRQGAAGIAIVVLAVAIVLLAGWWFLEGGKHEEAAAPPAPAKASEPAEDTAPTGPLYPVPATDSSDRPELRPLPPLDDSDEYFRMEIGELLGGPAGDMIVGPALVERVVATIDNLPRQRVAERLRPVAAPEGPFAVDGQDGSGEFQLSRDNYRRYDAAVAAFSAVDLDQAVELYQRFYPLFQSAYQGLGYPDGYFNDRLIEVIDHLLAAPDVEMPVLLVRPHVLYRYADEDIESASAGHKLMIRIGPEHRATVSTKLRELRTRLADLPER